MDKNQEVMELRKFKEDLTKLNEDCRKEIIKLQSYKDRGMFELVFLNKNFDEEINNFQKGIDSRNWIISVIENQLKEL